VLERPLLGAHITAVAALLQFGAGRTVEDEGKTDLHGHDLREMIWLRKRQIVGKGRG